MDEHERRRRLERADEFLDEPRPDSQGLLLAQWYERRAYALELLTREAEAGGNTADADDYRTDAAEHRRRHTRREADGW